MKETNINTRHKDVSNETYTGQKEGPFLPPIDWTKINQVEPIPLSIGERKPEDALPEVDWVILTWTSAEWFALDHVFINSKTKGDSSSHEFRKNWHQYTRGASDYHADKRSGELWGLFQLVQITDQSGRPWRVLLFKSNSHLAHSPWIDGLSAMMKCILTDTKAKRVYTIGTAGGARLNQSLGDAVITNSAVLKLQRPENTSDKDNGNSFRCPTWYPSTALVQEVQDNLLFKMDEVANNTSFTELFEQLKSKHSGDTSMDGIVLEDLVNDALSPSSLANPKIQSLKDVPLLTTDFYYVANGNNSDAYSFLEMDDAVIAREANAMGVDYACIRNISDPIVPGETKEGKVIPDSIRNDWSGLIYSTFGLYTSFNGALATWSTIVGEGTKIYNPTRGEDLSSEEDPLEVKLAFQVRSCGTCNFFWPKDKKQTTYGPYTAFDFDVSQPYPAKPIKGKKSYPWILGNTRPPSFPNGEIIDGCRKAAIMTLGINPNLTAFAPGQNGAPWAYPDFTSDNNTDAWAKYAWYYRYRSVYQEKLDLDFVKEYILPEGQVVAEKNGNVVEAHRPDSNPTWDIKIRYEGDTEDTTITLLGKQGDFPYMLFYDSYGDKSAFVAGEVIAAKVAVPEGIKTEIIQEEQGYYMQFVPSLKMFQDHLSNKGFTKANLEIGEDVQQIDMVACASPHWNEGFLGGELEKVVNNCVSENAWAVKQIVQSRPSVLYVVSESSWNMFKSVFGNFVDEGRISDWPKDNAYTLMRETTDMNNPVYVRFNITIDGIKYEHKIRLVITPHFSFNNNFVPQYRLSPSKFDEISETNDFKAAITKENGFDILPQNPKHSYYYREIQMDYDTYVDSRKKLKENYPDLYASLEEYFYNPHETMADVMIDMYDKGVLSYDADKNYLNRTEGSCKFCVNQHWQFKGECKYDKNYETAAPAGYLEKVAEYIIVNGKPEEKEND